MVKYEGPDRQVAERVVGAGVPVMGDLGLTPQSVNAFGGNRVQARTRTAVDLLVGQAKRLEGAEVSALVLEAVPSAAAEEVTTALGIPTIGIGAGPGCSGQILVGPEMLGMFSGHRSRFAKHYAEVASVATVAAQTFKADRAAGRCPEHEHSYDWEIKAQ
jgi:3-methyl-2-oxobutanoate hydroxymethyltransferase